MSFSAESPDVRWDGRSGAELATLVGLPRVDVHGAVSSTLDVAHTIAPGAPAGTLVLADEQTAGRGTHGRRWTSGPGIGVWLALVERPSDVGALSVLSLRCGLYAAEALEPLAAQRIGVKWPNDLYVEGRKLAGILIETRWRGGAPEWVAIGFGLNVRPPGLDTATGLPPDCGRVEALIRLVPALRRAAAMHGPLGRDELAGWHARDVARGRAIDAPARGIVDGITEGGELLVRHEDGSLARHRAGPLTFAEPLACS